MGTTLDDRNMMNGTSVIGGGTLLIAVLATLVTYNIYLTIYRLYFHPLAKFPGPKIAAVSGWHEFYYECMHGGRLLWEIRRLHDEYGPIIRIAPDELHIRDSDFYDELYTSGNKGRDKWARWATGTGAPLASVATVSHAHHRLRIGAVSPFFSKANIRRNEPQIKGKIARLLHRLDECKSNDQVIRLDCAYMALTMDIIAEFAFGVDYEHLNHPDFNIMWKEAIIGTLASQPFLKQFPWLLPLVKNLPVWPTELLDPKIGMMLRWDKIVHKEVGRILELNAQGKRAESTIFQAVLDSNLQPSEKTPQRLEDEGSVVVGAGSETTARCLAVVTYYLTSNRGMLQSLRDELKGVRKGDDGLFILADLEPLPYLNACIMEGMRLTGVAGRLPRVSREPIEYKGWVIPAHQVVSMANYHTHHDPAIFPEPYEYRPERWIEAAENGVRLDKYLVSFGRGSRACVGQNLAWVELYMALAHVLTRFDFELYDTELERDVVTARECFVVVPREDSKGIRAKIINSRA